VQVEAVGMMVRTEHRQQCSRFHQVASTGWLGWMVLLDVKNHRQFICQRSAAEILTWIVITVAAAVSQSKANVSHCTLGWF
jgi:hypothetical protein